MAQNIRFSEGDNGIYKDILNIGEWFFIDDNPNLSTDPTIINAKQLSIAFVKGVGDVYRKGKGPSNWGVALATFAGGSGGSVTGAKNSGTVPDGQQIFKEKDGTTLVFNNLTSDNTVRLQPAIFGDASSIKISVIEPNLTLTKNQVGLDNVNNIKDQLNSDRAPLSSDNGDAGYTVGSKWVSPDLDKAYICVRSTPSANEWKETTGVLNSFNNNFPPTSQGLNDGFSIGSRWIDIRQTERKEYLLVGTEPSVWIQTTGGIGSVSNVGTNVNGNLVGTLTPQGVQQIKGVTSSNNSILVSSTATDVSLVVDTNSLIVKKENINPSIDNVENIYNEYNGQTPPDSGDNSASVPGFSIGSRWVDVNNKKDYVCVKALNPAEWKETTATGTTPIIPTENYINAEYVPTSSTTVNTSTWTAIDWGGIIPTLGEYTEGFNLVATNQIEYIGQDAFFDINFSCLANGKINTHIELALFKNTVDTVNKLTNSLLVYYYGPQANLGGWIAQNASNSGRHRINTGDRILLGARGLPVSGATSDTVSPILFSIDIKEVIDQL